jgi:hypothetical protein
MTNAQRLCVLPAFLLLKNNKPEADFAFFAALSPAYRVSSTGLASALFFFYI